MKKNLYLFIILIMSVLTITKYSYGQESNFWTKTSSSEPSGKISPDAQYYNLDLQGLKKAVMPAGKALKATDQTSDLIITFPTSDGQIRRFSVSEASVLPPELSEKYPGIYSFAGRGIDDPTMTIRFSLSDYNGIRGVILASEKTTFIEPFNKSDLKNYKVYSGDIDDNFKFECLTSELGKKAESRLKSGTLKATDPNLRTYRAAISTTTLYGDYFKGTGTDQQKKANILAEINSVITQVNAIFERDLSVRLQLVPDNDKIIFFFEMPQPYKENYQEIIDDSIGFNNYDIGHTFRRLSDPEDGSYKGDAGCIACICSETKGLAYSAASLPDDPYFPLVVAHEMGHQMGAYHVQSSNKCISGNGQSEVEPGSGSTIMSYAGICEPSVEPVFQNYYNQISIRQIDDYIYTLSCGTSTNLGNSAPTANAGPDYIIPKSTPFVLTGQGSDPNGDQVTYTWEQNDPEIYDHVNYEDLVRLDRYYPSSIKTTGPMFQSYPPSNSPVRLLPNLETVLNDGPYLFEVLPSVPRVLNFVLTVRDNHPGGGRCEFDSMKVTVAGNSGPFEFSPSFDPGAYQAGSALSVTWNVAGTNTPPVSCQNVKISLSIDGGQTFAYVLKANTPNDGNENVTIPANISSSRCRLKIEAVNNIFYAISGKDFSIACGGCLASVPDSLHAQYLSAVNTVLTWTRGNNSDYEIRYREPGGTWNYQSVPDMQGNYFMQDSIINLTPASTYEAQVRSLCDGVNTITVRARGVTGQEHINLKVNNKTIGSVYLTTTLQNYTFETTLTGGIIVQYDNDQDSRNVVLDYVEVNGEIRQAEAQSTNTAAYANGQCGGGSYTEWMHCNGYIDFDNVNRNNITLRARGTLGGEHINLRINDNIVASYNLTTDFQSYTATFNVNGNITVEFDNDQGNSDVVVDYIIVNGNVRQAEDQSYNTAAYGDGHCGGGSYTEWMHCNGLIGFGDANTSETGSSGWSDTLTFTIPPSDYHPGDINTLLTIDQLNDTGNQLDWLTNPDPGTWTGVTWTSVVPKRVLNLEIDNKSLNGDIYAGGLATMEFLSIGNNSITSLNITGSSALNVLDCNSSFLTELDLSTQYNLDTFSCTNGLIREINLGSINQLTGFDASNNMLTSINLGNLNDLENFSIQKNYLAGLDVNNCTSLTDMNCDYNNLTSLEISNLSNLKNVSCGANKLTSLILSNLPNIERLNVWTNELTSIAGLNSLNTLTYLGISDNNFTSLNASNLTNLYYLFASSNALTSISGLSDLVSMGLISLDNNNFESIDLTPLSSRLTVYINYNKLNSIVLPSPSWLDYLEVMGNNLTELNLIGQDSLRYLIADENKLKRIYISGTHAPLRWVRLTLNNLPFTQLIKFSTASNSKYDPMNEIFDPVSSLTDITIDYSSEALIDGKTTSFMWYKDDQYITTNTTGMFTTAGDGVYYCKMFNGHFPTFTLTSAKTTIGSSGDCNFTVPMTSALPSLNKQYSYTHVIGSTSTLSNVNKFTINWSLENNGLWDISYNTSNGSPNWYVSLMGKVTQTFASSSPSMTISGSGISILDGNYWVTMDGDNFVMVDKSNNYAIYCSNSPTPPCSALKSSESFPGAGESLTSVKLYPNPSEGSIAIEADNTVKISGIKVCNLTGGVIYEKTDITENVTHISGLKAGVYMVIITTEGEEFNKKLVVY